MPVFRVSRLISVQEPCVREGVRGRSSGHLLGRRARDSPHLRYLANLFYNLLSYLFENIDIYSVRVQDETKTPFICP